MTFFFKNRYIGRRKKFAPPPSLGGLDLKRLKKGSRARSVERGGAGGKPEGWVAGEPSGGRSTWRAPASFKLPSEAHVGVGKSATSVGLRAPAGRFDATKGESTDTGSGERAVSSSPGRGDRGRQVAQVGCRATPGSAWKCVCLLGRRGEAANFVLSGRHSPAKRTTALRPLATYTPYWPGGLQTPLALVISPAGLTIRAIWQTLCNVCLPTLN